MAVSPSLSSEREAASATSLVQARDLFRIYREGAVETVALRGASLELRREEVTSLASVAGVTLGVGLLASISFFIDTSAST